jgi:hypothetical protein
MLGIISSLLLKIILQNTHVLHLFTRIIKTEIIKKVIKMPSWKTQVERPSGIIKMREEVQAL